MIVLFLIVWLDVLAVCNSPPGETAEENSPLHLATCECDCESSVLTAEVTGDPSMLK